MTASVIRQLSVWQWRLLVLLIYAIPLREGIKNGLWAALVALWIIRCNLENSWPKIGRIGWAVFFWLAAGAWSSCFAIEMDQSLKGFWDMLRSIVLIWIVSDSLCNERKRAALFRHVVISTAVSCVIALLQYGWEASKPTAYLPKLHLQLSSVGHFNQSAIYLAIGWLVALAVVLDNRIFHRHQLPGSSLFGKYHLKFRLLDDSPAWVAGDFDKRLLKWTTVFLLICQRYLLKHFWVGRLSLIVIGLSLLATTGRFAIAVATFASAIILFRMRPSRWLVQFLIWTLFAVGVGMVISSSLRERVLFQGSFSNRVLIWQSAWDAMWARPWTGVGLNNFKNINLQTRDPLTLGSVDHAHNLYFNTLAQLGIPGAIALLALLATSGALIWKYRPTMNRRELWFYGVGGGWFVIVLVGLSNTTLHHEMSMLFFILMGVLARTDQLPEKRQIF